MRLAQALLQLIVAISHEPIQSSALRTLCRPPRGNRHDISDASARVATPDCDTSGDFGRPPQRLYFAKAILLDHGPGRRLQSFETARCRLLYARASPGRRDWWNALRDG